MRNAPHQQHAALEANSKKTAILQCLCFSDLYSYSPILIYTVPSASINCSTSSIELKKEGETLT